MRELGLGTQLGYADLRESWLNRTLPSNLPVFLIARSGRLPDELLNQARARPDETSGVFDTHPSDADRVRAAEALAAPGVLVGGDGPGTDLFRDFEGLSVAATRHHYEHDLGLSLETATLVEIDDAIRDSASRQENQQAVSLFLGERASWHRLFPVALTDVAALSPAEIQAVLRASRDAMSVDSGLAAKYRLFESLETTRDQAVGAQEVLGAGFERVIAEQFDLTDGTAEDALATEARAVEQQQALAPDLARFEEIAARRLACGVRLLGTEEASALAGALTALSGVQAHLVELRRLTQAESQLLHNQAGSARPDLMGQCLTQNRQAHRGATQAGSRRPRRRSVSAHPLGDAHDGRGVVWIAEGWRDRVADGGRQPRADVVLGSPRAAGSADTASRVHAAAGRSRRQSVRLTAGQAPRGPIARAVAAPGRSARRARARCP